MTTVCPRQAGWDEKELKRAPHWVQMVALPEDNRHLEEVCRQLSMETIHGRPVNEEDLWAPKSCCTPQEREDQSAPPTPALTAEEHVTSGGQQVWGDMCLSLELLEESSRH